MGLLMPIVPKPSPVKLTLRLTYSILRYEDE